MLDRRNPIKIDKAPEVAVYGDDRDPVCFYLLASRPRLARVDGKAQVRLLVHVEGDQPSGAVFTATTTLGVTQTERNAVQLALSRDLRVRSVGAGEPRLSPLDWHDGIVRLRLLEDIELVGRPALFGDNECVFQGKLSSRQAVRLEEDWTSGRAELITEYSLCLSGRQTTDSSTFVFRGPLISEQDEPVGWIQRVKLD
ncbi:MAG: hypothetical protein AB7U75_22665 [Hyphomicrobiaceae bacterium]